MTISDIIIGEYMGVKFDVSSPPRSGGSGDQPIPGSMEEMEEKFKHMVNIYDFVKTTLDP